MPSESLRVDPAALGETADAVDLSGITGFHYYAGLYDCHQVLLIRPVWDFAEEILTYGLQFTTAPAES